MFAQNLQKNEDDVQKRDTKRRRKKSDGNLQRGVCVPLLDQLQTNSRKNSTQRYETDQKKSVFKFYLNIMQSEKKVNISRNNIYTHCNVKMHKNRPPSTRREERKHANS